MLCNAVGIAQITPQLFWSLTLKEYNKVMKASFLRCGLQEVKPQGISKTERDALLRDYGGTSRSIKTRGEH